MTDERSPDQPPNEQNQDAMADTAGEEDLDALLENASALAAELSDDGGPQEERKGEAADEPLAGGTDSTGDIDRKLNEMERLLDAAGDEMGLDADASGVGELLADEDLSPGESDSTTAEPSSEGNEVSSPAPEEPDPAEQISEKTGDPIGDSAAADGPSPESPADRPDGEQTSDPPNENNLDPADVAGREDLPSPDDIPSLDEESSGTDTETAGGEGDPAAADAGDGSESDDPSDDPGIRSKLSSIALKGCTCGASILEIVDRPFTQVSANIRIWIGWAALATLATAIVVFLSSLF